jgi:hypothetical protein
MSYFIKNIENLIRQHDRVEVVKDLTRLKFGDRIDCLGDVFYGQYTGYFAVVNNTVRFYHAYSENIKRFFPQYFLCGIESNFFYWDLVSPETASYLLCLNQIDKKDKNYLM